jgi:acyl-coenzyme A synthetase/AMP-(fatty) acid ligase
MPMVPEAVIAMMACARLGAIRSVVFGGFAAHELAARIADCNAKLVICASCGIEPNRVVTSGTTGLPKGIVRDNGSHAVALKWSMEAVYGAKPGEVFWAASDIGWVLGHSYIVYAPLLHGCTSILYGGQAGGYSRRRGVPITALTCCSPPLGDPGNQARGRPSRAPKGP